MGLFLYKAIDNNGKKISGRIQASSLQEAKSLLQNQGLSLLKLAPRSIWNPFFKKRESRLSAHQRILFTTQLSQLLSAGLPIYESLSSLEEQYKGEQYHSLITTITTSIKEGKSVSEAMSLFPQSFPPLYLSMVHAGEQVGLLPQTLEKLAQLLQKQEKLRKQLVTALLYPLILLGFSFGLVALLLTYVVPSLEALFEDRPVHPYTALVFTVSYYVRHYWGLILAAIFALAGGVYYGFKRRKWRVWAHKQGLRLPGINQIIIKAAIARFCRTMGTLLDGGVTIIKALQISRAVMKQPQLEELIEKAEEKIIEGSLLSKELSRSPHIPSLVVRLLSVAEEGGTSAQMHNKIADLYEEDVEKVLTRLTTLAQPVILLVIGCLVGLIMLAILLPLTDVSSFINS